LRNSFTVSLCADPWTCRTEQERSGNVKAGQALAGAKGKEIGRPREIDPSTAEKIRALRASGHGYQAIAQIVDASYTTLRRMLKDSNLKVE
jgi:DNA invertase Pin-like site-specific DNA recombinase